MALPRISLPATTGDDICVADGRAISILVVYPWSGRPGYPNPPDWDEIPGAHGSTPELEGFRDLASQFAALEVALLVFPASQRTGSARWRNAFDFRSQS
jgi:peroxiredoxin